MIQWTDSLKTGEDLIDADHREIIARINAIEQAIKEGAPKPELLRTLEFLDSYTRVHFSREETLMSRVRCPVHQGNCVAHQLLIQKLARWKAEIEKGYNIPLLLDVYRELSQWIVTHIMQVDCQLRGHREERP